MTTPSKRFIPTFGKTGEPLSIYLAGHTGLVGSAFLRLWSQTQGVRLVTASRLECDLTDAQAVESLLRHERPDWAILAAGKVGGILANSTYPAEFIYENLMIETNLIHAAWKAGVKRLLNFGSSCMYPKFCPQPMHPDQLMAGKMEPTSQPYAIAKLAGMCLVDSYNRQYGTRYLTVIPCTVYGPGDSFDLHDAHVIPALLRKIHEAKEAGSREVILLGSGAPRREFIYSDDVAQACELLLTREEVTQNPINLGPGISYSIREIAQEIAQLIGFEGKIAWDRSCPDGAAEKLLDSRWIQSLGWKPKVNLKEGLKRTYRWFLEQRVCVSS